MPSRRKHAAIGSMNQHSKLKMYKQIQNDIRSMNEFERDLLAMKKVCQLLKRGAIRWFGEVGRQF